MKHQSKTSIFKLGFISLFIGLAITLFVITMTPVAAFAQINFQAHPPSDVSPSDFYYPSLESLGRKYGCAPTYPDGTFRGNRQLTRYELAATLNACMQQVERIIANSGQNAVTKSEVAALKNQIDNLQEQVNQLQFFQRTRSGDSPL